MASNKGKIKVVSLEPKMVKQDSDSGCAFVIIALFGMLIVAIKMIELLIKMMNYPN